MDYGLGAFADWSTGAVASVLAPLSVATVQAADNAVNSLVYSGFPSPPAPLPPPAVVNPSQADLGQSAIDASLQAGATANQANLAQFFGNVADTNANANFGLSIWFWLALGLGVLAVLDLTKQRGIFR